MMVKVLLLVFATLAVSQAFVCPPGFCDKVDCEKLDDCLEENGQTIREKGSFCNCCDICIKVLGEGERCQPLGELLGLIVPSECAKGLYCDRTQRKCLRE